MAAGEVTQGQRRPDGTVTVSPSIWWDKPDGWHGYLERGLWREV